NHFALVVADVSGKGIPAALFMARSMTVIRMLTKPGVLLSEVFSKANNYLCENNQEGLFVTAFEAILDIRTGKVEYVNAGHEKPFIRDKSGKYNAVEVDPGFVLGAIEDIEYNTGTIQMEPGDRFIEYTDGVAEATNVNNELFGEKRLEQCLNNNSGDDVRFILQAILQDIDKFTMDADQFDDITILAMEYKNKVTKHSLQVVASLEKYEEVQSFILDNLIEVELTETELADLNIMIEEIFVNIASYAYKDMDIPDSEKTVEIILERLGEGMIKIQFADKGIEFNPLMKNDPDINADYNDRGIGGLGIYMVKKSMDNVEYIREGTQNVLTVTNTYKMQNR
ncbi:MAG: SpoIIE family protein phosphatase, partial [Lachnospiraceae bacterium]|nr:SpoIIE family protein phosphatase [Lachnospiraceae bacterium]